MGGVKGLGVTTGVTPEWAYQFLVDLRRSKNRGVPPPWLEPLNFLYVHIKIKLMDE